MVKTYFRISLGIVAVCFLLGFFFFFGVANFVPQEHTMSVYALQLLFWRDFSRDDFQEK